MYDDSAILGLWLCLSAAGNDPKGMAAPGTEGLVELAVWTIVLLALAVLMAVVLLAVRHRFRRNARIERTGFTMEQLRRMRASGVLTEAQYKDLQGKALAGG